MTKKEPDSKNKNPTLGPEDEALWRSVVKKTKPLTKRPKAPAAPQKPQEVEKPKAEKKLPQRRVKPSPPPEPEIRVSKVAKPGGLERGLADKLRRGKLRPDGRLDLHGFRQEEAHQALIGFLTRAQARDKRLVLVITGKGDAYYSGGGGDSGDDDEGNDSTARQSGILRRMLPMWLDEPPLRPLIAGFQPAHRHDGGDGAFYIHIRKPR